MTSQRPPTPPTRPRLPTAAEADEMSGRAFLEAFREVNEEKRATPRSRVDTCLRRELATAVRRPPRTW
jgi:hypothetical protein